VDFQTYVPTFTNAVRFSDPNGVVESPSQTSAQFPAPRACVVAPLALTATKVPVVFDGRVDGNGSDAESVRFRYTVTRSATGDNNADGTAVALSLYDQMIYSSTIVLGGVITHTAQATNCSGPCPPQWPSYPFPLVDSRNNGINGATPSRVYTAYPFSQSAPTISMQVGESTTFDVDIGYAGLASSSCVSQTADLSNTFAASPTNLPAGADQWTGGANAGAIINIDPDLPRCVDIAVNKMVSPANPSANQPITFTLDFTNSTNNAIGVVRTASNVAIQDVLGTYFNATAASCSVLSGTATAPTVSLVNITGTNNTFNAVIASMDDGATVRCQISGRITTPGSYNNVATANGTTGTTRTGLFDIRSANNAANVNVGISAPATVTVTKQLTGATAGYVAGSTWSACPPATPTKR